MRVLALLYWRLAATYTASRFNWLYYLNHDPFGVEHTPYERCKREALLRFIAQRHHTNALDLGCGTGIQTKRLAPYCDHILGVDFSAKAISLAKASCKDETNIMFTLEDIRIFCGGDKYPLYPKYDLLVCSEVLYYLDAHSLDAVIESFASISTLNAWLVLVGRADDQYVFPRFVSRFILIDRIENCEWRRPFAVSLFKRVV